MFHIVLSRCALALALFTSIFFHLPVLADNAKQQVEIQGVRIWHSPDKSRIVFDLSKPANYQILLLDSPGRYVVEFEAGVNKKNLPDYVSNERIGDLRFETSKEGHIRYVIPSKKQLRNKNFLLAPNSIYGDRLVLDLLDAKVVDKVSSSGKTIVNKDNAKTSAVSIAEVQSTNDLKNTVQKPTPKKPIKRVRKKQLVVAIDAGHGGEDPGALGSKVYEKKITLAIAKQLAKKVNSNKNMKAVLIRTSDYFIRLRSRTTKARAAKADLFISIHADAALNKSARGMSVFALSQRGASSELARSLARKENQSDLIGGVSIKDKDDALAEVLLDLSMTNTISESVEFGSFILKRLSKVGKLHSKRVEQAGFAVLKSPDIPSVLVETGFITNRSEERLLMSSKYQQSIVNNIYGGIIDYVAKNPVMLDSAQYELTPSDGNAADIDFNTNYSDDSILDTKYHTVKSGDYLSKIAATYGISLKQLKQWNNLKSNVAVKGKRLRVSERSSTSSSSVGSYSSTKSDNSKKVITYKVRNGDSLSVIADKYGVTMSSIRKRNKLKNSNVYIGQRLKIETNKPVSKYKSSNNSKVSSAEVHVVKSGEYLSGISKRYNITISYLKKLNNLKSGKLYVGQKLKLSSNAASTMSPQKNSLKTIKHTVRNGQTLSGLALKYRVKQSDIVKWNKLRKRHLFVGQRLTIKTRK